MTTYFPEQLLLKGRLQFWKFKLAVASRSVLLTIMLTFSGYSLQTKGILAEPEHSLGISIWLGCSLALTSMLEETLFWKYDSILPMKNNVVSTETASFFYAWTLTEMEIAFPASMAELQWKLLFSFPQLPMIIDADS